VSRRRVVCRVCGEGFAPRTHKQDVCDLRCCYRDPRRHVGYPMKLMQAALKRERERCLRRPELRPVPPGGRLRPQSRLIISHLRDNRVL
jgi:hypothetical protein